MHSVSYYVNHIPKQKHDSSPHMKVTEKKPEKSLSLHLEKSMFSI